jgi:hypothetical protein
MMYYLLMSRHALSHGINTVISRDSLAVAARSCAGWPILATEIKMENKNRCESSFATRPIMYEVGARYQEIVGRDDLWAVSTEELNILQDVVNEAAVLLQDMADNKETYENRN